MAKPKFKFNKNTGVVTPKNASAIALQKKQSGLPNYGEGQQPGIFTSTNPYAAKIDVNTPQQQAILDHLSKMLPAGLSGLNIPGKQSSFGPIEEQARANFNENTIPGLAERFASLGSGGSLNSSAFGQALGGAGAGFERDLAALKAEHGLQEQDLQSRNIFNLLSSGLNPQFSAGIVPGQDSTARTVFKKGIPFAADLLKSYLGGPSNNTSSSNNSTNNNGSGINPNNSFGFTQNPGWTPTYGNLSIQKLANPGFGHLNQNLSGGI